LTEENLIVEILQGNRPCKAGEKGELVITELHNRTMPLIRYRTGDFAAFSDKPCPCGRTLRCIEELYGRAYDFVVDAQGRQFHGELLVYVFEEAKRIESGIGQFQVTQLAVDRFHVKIVPSAGFTESTQQMILRRMQSLLGAEINVRFDLVTEIPRERSGKMRVIVGMPDNAT
jgi:phenylacetate-CoA ligase